MRREFVRYQGELIQLPARDLPGGGWVDWSVTWRGRDGTQKAVDELQVTATGGSVLLTNQGGPYWRLIVSPETQTSPQRRGPGLRFNQSSQQQTTILTAMGLVDGSWLPVARQEVRL